MKLKEQIFKGDSDELFNCEIYYDEEILKGLYTVATNSYIRKNVKSLDIEYQIPDDNKRIGVKYSKQFDCVVLTIVFFDAVYRIHKFQFIIKEHCKVEDVYKSNHYLLNGLREVIVGGIQMAYARTLGDVDQWFKDNK